MVLKLTGGLHFHWGEQFFFSLLKTENHGEITRKHVLSDNKIVIETGKNAKSNRK